MLNTLRNSLQSEKILFLTHNQKILLFIPDDDDTDDSSYDSYENIVSPSSGPASSTTTPTSTATTKSHATTRVPTPDPYFTHFEPKDEHHAFKEALQRLEEMHREKVTKVRITVKNI